VQDCWADGMGGWKGRMPGMRLKELDGWPAAKSTRNDWNKDPVILVIE
jgi:hypothetical protein